MSILITEKDVGRKVLLRNAEVAEIVDYRSGSPWPVCLRVFSPHFCARDHWVTFDGRCATTLTDLPFDAVAFVEEEVTQVPQKDLETECREAREMESGVWYDLEDAPVDGTVIIGATYDRRHIAAIFMKYCDGDMEGAWVTERSHSPIRWIPQCWTIVPPKSSVTPKDQNQK